VLDGAAALALQEAWPRRDGHVDAGLGGDEVNLKESVAGGETGAGEARGAGQLSVARDVDRDGDCRYALDLNNIGEDVCLTS
jgi:hypothetical protein